MGQSPESALKNMAALLISMGALSSCGGESAPGMTTVRYESSDKGLSMPGPKIALREKCFGIAKAQFNDCAAGPGTNCAGTADKDYMPGRWKYLPAGACEGEGGTLEPTEEAYKSEK
jgi:uncharacterized membrane protein